MEKTLKLIDMAVRLQMLIDERSRTGGGMLNAHEKHVRFGDEGFLGYIPPSLEAQKKNRILGI